MNNKNVKNHNKTVEEVYYSVDVEADGPIPGPYSMSSFGIVACAYRTRDGQIVKLDLDAAENCLYLELKPISDDFIPEALAVGGLDRQDLIENGADPVDAMKAVVEFINNHSKQYGEHTRAVFAGYPLGFDWIFIYWYLLNFAKVSPFGHSSHLDMKSYYAAKADVAIRKIGKRSLPAEIRSRRKHSHNALDDAREQGEICQNLLVWGSGK